MKRQKGRTSSVPSMGIKKLGDYSIISKEPARITAAQISAVILTLKRKMPAETTIIPRIYAHLAVSQKPLEVRMGKGKGAIGKRVARIRINTVLFEVVSKKEGTPKGQIIAGLKAAGSKLPVRIRIESKEREGKKIVKRELGKSQLRENGEGGNHGTIRGRSYGELA